MAGSDQQKTVPVLSGRQRQIAALTNAGKGRPKGVPNKVTTKIKDMVIEALSKAGGIDYLAKQAKDNPAAFMTLVGKVIPLQITGEDGGPVQVTRIELVAVKPE